MFRRFATLLRQLGTTEKKPARRVRLGVEILEDRTVPANASGTITGTAFIDANGNGVFDGGDGNVQGVSVTLVGSTTQSTPINVTAVTDLNGKFTIDNVLPGTYQLSAGGAPNVIGAVLLGNLSLPAGVTVNQQTSTTTRGGLVPQFVCLSQFMTSTTQGDISFGTAGSGNALANFRPNSTPTIATALATVNAKATDASTQIDLAANFSDPDITNSQVTFTFSYAGQNYAITVNLLDTTAPQTVANFFDYVTGGAYDSSIITRLVSGFVLQGGAMDVDSTGTVLTQINNHGNTVPNEFGASNVQGTLAMAKKDGDLNSATSQWFFNLADNSGSPNNLDSTTNKFTVFGQAADTASLIALAQLSAAASASTQDFHSSALATANPEVDFKNVPMTNYSGTSATFPGDATLANYLVLNNIAINKRDEFLTYQVSVNVTSGPSNLVVATLNGEHLTLTYPSGGTGSASVTVTATDRYGVSTNQTFTVNVGPGDPSAAQSALAVSSNNFAVGDSATVTLTAKDANGNQLTTGGATVLFGLGSTTGGVGLGSFSSVTDNHNGTYTATFTATASGTNNTITATINGTPVTATQTITFP